MGRPRQERFNLTRHCAGLGGEGSYLGGKASWGWAAEKGAAKVRCDLVHVIEQCTTEVQVYSHRRAVYTPKLLRTQHPSSTSRALSRLHASRRCPRARRCVGVRQHRGPRAQPMPAWGKLVPFNSDRHQGPAKGAWKLRSSSVSVGRGAGCDLC